MEYVSKSRVVSKIDPGITYVLNLMNAGRRTELRLALAKVSARLRELTQDSIEVENTIAELRSRMTPEQRTEVETRVAEYREKVLRRERVDVVPSLPAELARLGLVEPAEARRLERERARIADESQTIDESELHPAWIEWGLSAIEGLTIDGVAATPQTLRFGPEEIYREVLGMIEHELGFTEQELKNSASPTTSTAPADGPSPSTTAATAAGSGLTASA